MGRRPRRSRQIPGRRLVKRWRKAQVPAVSCAELGRRLSCDGSTIRHFEAGRSELSLALCLGLSRETGVHLSKLLPPESIREIREAAALLGPNGNGDAK